MHTDWGHGYNVAQGYTYGFYREMAPHWLDYAVQLAGQRPPAQAAQAPLRYLELGCGQGMNLLVMAAACPEIEFVGVDFHPLHIAHAQRLAQVAGLANVQFHEEDFAALAHAWPQALGQFDYVTLHGIYTWVTPELRRAVVQCLERAVRPAGLVYNGYNTLPGWLSAVPLQHLLRMQQLDAGLPPQQAITAGHTLMQQLQAASAGVFTALPSLAQRTERLLQVDASYAVQEYLHDDSWHPLWHSQVAAELATAKLSHVATATLPESYLPALLSADKQAIVHSARGSALRQDLIDTVVNQVFRRDIFQRGAQAMWPAQAQAMQQAQAFILVAAPGDDEVVVRTVFGDVSLKRGITDALCQRLATGPASYGELASLPALAGIDASAVQQAISFLLHAGHWALYHPQADVAAAQRLNTTLAAEVCEGAPYDVVACSHTGTGANASKVDLLLLDAMVQAGSQEEQPLAQGLRARMQRLGLQFAQSDADTDAQARAQAQRFLTQTLPAWRRLGAWQ